MLIILVYYRYHGMNSVNHQWVRYTDSDKYIQIVLKLIFKILVTTLYQTSSPP